MTIFMHIYKESAQEAVLLAAQFAYLIIWLLGMFGIIGIVVGSLARFILQDSLAYDEPFVWGRKLPADVKR
jgi:hypothetical protein